MNEYFLQQRIKTKASLDLFENGSPSPMVVDGITFTNWDFSIQDGPRGDSWIAEGKESAIDFHTAASSFRKKLSTIIPKIAFVSQCYMEYSQQSFLIQRINDNPRNIFWILYASEREGTGLGFMEEEKKDFDRITLQNKEFFWYMNDCYNTIGYTAKLLLLFSALECLAGKEIKTDDEGNQYSTYNKDVMKEILGNREYGFCFGTDGLRHKLSHGDYIASFPAEENHVEKIHKSILEYFNRKYLATLNLDVVHPQRHFFGNGSYIRTFLEPKQTLNQANLLKDVTYEFVQSDTPGSSSDLASFDYIFEDPFLEIY